MIGCRKLPPQHFKFPNYQKLKLVIYQQFFLLVKNLFHDSIDYFKVVVSN